MCVCVCSTRAMPQRGQDRSPKGLRERNIYIASEIMSSDLDKSQKLIFWCKTRIVVVPQKIGMPA